MGGRCAAQLRSICGRDPEFAALHKSSLTRQGPPGNPFVGIGPCRPTPGPAYGSIETCREWFRSAVISVTFVFPKLSCSFSRTCRSCAEQAAAAIGGVAPAGGLPLQKKCEGTQQIFIISPVPPPPPRPPRRTPPPRATA